MTFTFEEHLHRYAVWTAARAAQRGFTTTENISDAIQKTELRSLISGIEVQDYDNFHRQSCGQIIGHFKVLDLPEDKITYGRAAKIVAIYIKTAIVIRDPLGPLAKMAHPPIDRIILFNHGYRDNWTELTEERYFELINILRPINDEPFWTIEEKWVLNSSKT
jgi:hypothetical protein